MRPQSLPLVSRDGAANKDTRLTNILKESDGRQSLTGDVVRPESGCYGSGNRVVAGFTHSMASLSEQACMEQRSGPAKMGMDLSSPLHGRDMEWRGRCQLGGAVWGFYGFTSDG